MEETLNESRIEYCENVLERTPDHDDFLYEQYKDDLLIQKLNSGGKTNENK